MKVKQEICAKPLNHFICCDVGLLLVRISKRVCTMSCAENVWATDQLPFPKRVVPGDPSSLQ